MRIVLSLVAALVVLLAVLMLARRQAQPQAGPQPAATGPADASATPGRDPRSREQQVRDGLAEAARQIEQRNDAAERR